MSVVGGKVEDGNAWFSSSSASLFLFVEKRF